MSGYNFVVGVAAIIIIALLWIVFGEVISGGSGILSVLNGMAGGDATIIQANNTLGSVFYYSLFIIIIIIGIWILKSSIKEDPPYYTGGGYV